MSDRYTPSDAENILKRHLKQAGGGGPQSELVGAIAHCAGLLALEGDIETLGEALKVMLPNSSLIADKLLLGAKVAGHGDEEMAIRQLKEMVYRAGQVAEDNDLQVDLQKAREKTVGLAEDLEKIESLKQLVTKLSDAMKVTLPIIDDPEIHKVVQETVDLVDKAMAR